MSLFLVRADDYRFAVLIFSSAACRFFCALAMSKNMSVVSGTFAHPFPLLMVHGVRIDGILPVESERDTGKIRYSIQARERRPVPLIVLFLEQDETFVHDSIDEIGLVVEIQKEGGLVEFDGGGELVYARSLDTLLRYEPFGGLQNGVAAAVFFLSLRSEMRISRPPFVR